MTEPNETPESMDADSQPPPDADWQTLPPLPPRRGEIDAGLDATLDHPAAVGGVPTPAPPGPLPTAAPEWKTATRSLTRKAGGPDVPGYEILGELGRGGMGVVYKAKQIGLNRIVALKMVLTAGMAGRDELVRFQHEAELVAQLQHPNIVQIYEVGETGGQPYFSLEFVEGGSLASELNGTPWGARPAAQLVAKLAAAMHVAHQRNIIHRDLKPANILLAGGGRNTGMQGAKGKAANKTSSVQSALAEIVPKITDFGLAKKLDDSAGATQSGAVLGTPSYMAPEQAEGKNRAIGPATDTYALGGAILYELLTGRPPFRGQTPFDTVLLVAKAEPVPPSRLQPGVPRDLETICLKCLRKRPTERYASSLELSEDLNRFLDGQPIRGRPVGLTERLSRWSRKHRLGTALVGLVILICLTGVGLAFFEQPAWALAALQVPVAAAGAWGYWTQRHKAELEMQRAEEQGQQAEEAKREVEGQVRKTEEALAVAEANLYFLQISLAERELSTANVARAEQLLDACPRIGRNWEWHYLNRLCHAELFTWEGHERPPLCVAFSPDGKHLAAAGWDQNILVVADPAGNPSIVHTLQGHTAQVTGLAYSPDGQHLASSSGDRSIVIWDAKTGTRHRHLQGHQLSVFAVAYGPDGRRIVSAGGDQVARIWSASSGNVYHVLKGHEREVTSVACSPDGELIATGSRDGSIILWDPLDGKEMQTLRGHAGAIYSLAFSPNSDLLASASDDRTVRIWQIPGGREVNALRGHAGAVYGVAFHPEGDRIATASWDRTLRVWNVADGRERTTYRGHHGIVCAVAYSRDGRYLATSSEDCTVRLWDATSGPEARVLRGHQHPILDAAFSPDSPRLLTAGGHQVGEVKLWDTSAVCEAPLALQELPAVRAVAYSPNGLVIALGFANGEALMVNAVTGAAERRFQAHERATTDMVFSPDGKHLITGGEDGTAKVWDVAKGIELHVFRVGLAVGGLACAPDAERVAVATSDRITGKSDVTIWNRKNGKQITQIAKDTVAVNEIAFSPNGRQLATAHHDGAIRLWNSTRFAEPQEFSGHTNQASSVAFNPDGQRLASGSHDQTVKLWDVVTGEAMLTLRGHTGEVTRVAFSPDGQRLASVAADQTVRIWDAMPLGAVGESTSSKLSSSMQDSETLVRPVT